MEYDHLTREQKQQLSNGCFNIIIAILGAFAIGGLYGWPVGVFALIVAFYAIKIFNERGT